MDSHPRNRRPTRDLQRNAQMCSSCSWDASTHHNREWISTDAIRDHRVEATYPCSLQDERASADRRYVQPSNGQNLLLSDRRCSCSDSPEWTTLSVSSVPTSACHIAASRSGIPFTSLWAGADPTGMGDSRRLIPPATTRALRALVHPVSILALGVLIINDHILKDAYPGFVTGKLSDIAGLAFFPILLAALFGLLRLPDRAAFVAATATTALWFTGMKTTTVAARFTESLAEVFVPQSTIVVDPTDLIALPMVLIALAILSSTPLATAATPRSPIPGRRVLETSALILGAVASMATSCDESNGITDLTVQGPVVIAQVEYGGGYQSSDGFASWERAERTQPDARSSKACLPDETCFRIDGGPYVTMSTNGGP